MSTTLPDYEGNYYSDSEKDEPEHVAPNIKAKQGTRRKPFRAPCFPSIDPDPTEVVLATAKETKHSC